MERWQILPMLPIQIIPVLIYPIYTHTPCKANFHTYNQQLRNKKKIRDFTLSFQPSNMMGASRLAHLGVSGPFSGIGPVSSHGKLKQDFFLTVVFSFENLTCCVCTNGSFRKYFSTEKLTNDKYAEFLCSLFKRIRNKKK